MYYVVVFLFLELWVQNMVVGREVVDRDISFQYFYIGLDMFDFVLYCIDYIGGWFFVVDLLRF